MEDKNEEMVDAESTSDDSFIVDSDYDETSIPKEEDDKHFEEPLTEQEIEELVAEFLEVESKAAEAQEALEKESLAKLESEVRDELAQTLHGDDLEEAAKDEMTTYREEWEAVLDELETESAQLLEQLDGAGIELPKLYKWVESQAPNSCCTEAWKRRAHWVGSQVNNDITEAVANAEEYLQTHRPVRRRHGKLLEEGASGFLQKKITMDGSKEVVPENKDVDWASLKELFSGGATNNSTSFGSKQWASVYLANTPQEAAAMGLKFPGVNEVEEIEDIDGSSSDPFVAEAIENEKDLVLSEEQQKHYRKVKEEDDAQIDRKLQHHLKQRRRRKRSKQVKEINPTDVLPLDDEANCMHNEKNHEYGDSTLEKDLPESSKNLDKERTMSNGSASSTETGSLKRQCDNEDEELKPDWKKSRAVITDSDDESESEKDKFVIDDIKAHYQSTWQETNGDTSAENHASPGLTEVFHCTACENVSVEVHKHPLLKVIICKDCKFLMEKKLYAKDMECSECYCAWCGRNSELVSCKSCKTLFCTTCIKRNIGEEYLSKVKATGWNCCCCSPTLIKRLTTELEKILGSSVLSSSSSDSDTENSDAEVNAAISSKRKRKKKIRRILDDAELGEDTQKKIAIEKERQERLKSLQGQFSNRSNTMHFTSFTGDLPEGATVEVLGDAATGYIVNVVREKGEEPVRIPPSISAKLKAHQVAGIRFMWENIIQSIGKVKSGDRGLGCILAHTMGLGKTFQVIAFLYTAMRSVDLGLKTALIVTPVNVLHNWRQEFMKWKPSELKTLRVYMLEDVSRERRAELLAKWRSKGGVFLIGYTAFRNLSLGKVKDRNMAREMCNALQDGPDILICDEAHMIKNTKADTTQALKQVKCQRRIALTGSPLQNNLMEYYCMVDFVREGFLGSSLEFRNRFQNPIVNGQHTNSTAEDVKIMNQRSHILYEQLKGFVQRMDMSVVKKDLPPKTVFVIAVKLSPLQRKLYKRFLDVHGFTKDKASNEKMRKSFFAGYQALAQIWNHPGILHLRKDKDYSSREDTVENFLADDSSGDENLDYNTINGEKLSNENGSMYRKSENGFFHKGWWIDLLNELNYKELDYSGKMVLLLDILTMSSEVGDKVLVFSQSIPTLDLIELYLSKLPRPGRRGKVWKKGKDWYRLDGRTESSERQKLVEKFNDPENKRVKCTLISTRAGSLGINLHAANRVVIVDGSWNPTFDLQAIYRAWRYGQKKPVFAYRLMAHGTMEEKIYKRQVTKEGLAARVVDRQQVHRTISKEEMLHLFEFGDDENPDALDELGQEDGQPSNCGLNHQASNSLKQKVPPHGSCSSDKLMESLLSKHHARWIANYHEHETLLQENEEEKLTKEEQDMAWEVYRKSLQWEEVQRVPIGESTYDKRPSTSNTAPVPDYSTQPTSNATASISDIIIPLPRGLVRNRKLQRKCTNLAHLLTLRSQGTKYGCTAICGECAQEISWADLKKDGSKIAT